MYPFDRLLKPSDAQDTSAFCTVLGRITLRIRSLAWLFGALKVYFAYINRLGAPPVKLTRFSMVAFTFGRILSYDTSFQMETH